MKTLTAFLAISALAVAAAAGPLQAEEDPIDPADATIQALRALLAVSNAEIPASSSCQDWWYYEQAEKATVKDLLAVQLSHMYEGKNVIRGDCHRKLFPWIRPYTEESKLYRQCAVYFNHAVGETITSSVIAFDLAQGEASVPTLQCLTIP